MSGLNMLPWSFSRLTDYERCPHYAYTVHVMKQKGPSSPYAARGQLIHDAASNYVLGTTKTLHKELKNYKAELKALRGLPGLTSELKVGLTAKWQGVEFFRGKGLWARYVIDLKWFEGDVIHVRDIKTGRPYPDHEDQLRLYAAAELAQRPEAKLAKVADWYVDHPVAHKLEREITQAEGQRIRKTFEARVKKMIKDPKFEARPNAKCKWCHLNRVNGGACDAPN